MSRATLPVRFSMMSSRPQTPGRTFPSQREVADPLALPALALFDQASKRMIKTQELEAKILKLEDNISEELKKMDATLDRNFEAMLAAIARQGQPAIPPPN